MYEQQASLEGCRPYDLHILVSGFVSVQIRSFSALTSENLQIWEVLGNFDQ